MTSGMKFNYAAYAVVAVIIIWIVITGGISIALAGDDKHPCDNNHGSDASCRYGARTGK